MSSESPDTKKPRLARDVSASTVSSGGGGTFFEQHVAAFWLTQLLTRCVLPIVKDSTCVEVQFQTERLGWATDDFIVVGQNGAGRRRRLIGQVKRSFAVSASDEECAKAFKDYWADYKKPDWVSADDDRFVLVTLRGTNTLLDGLAGLLDHARAARNPDEFVRRLGTSGLVGAKATRYCDEIRAIIGSVEGRSLTAGEIWGFLRLLHVLSLDLTTGTAQSEAAATSLLAYTATKEGDAEGAAADSWNALLRLAGEALPSGLSFRREDLPAELVGRHSPVAGGDHRAIQALTDHSTMILSGIKSTIGKDVHLARTQLVQAVLDQLGSSQVVVISGPAGSGKSGVAKGVVERLKPEHFVFCFRAEEFATAHLDATLQRAQIPASAASLGATLAGQQRKVMLVESAERLLEASTRDGFSDLLALLSGDQSWQMLITCRDYSTDLVRDSLLAAAGLAQGTVSIAPLSEDELREAADSLPALARPLGDAAMRRLLRNPYFLDKALLVPWAEHRVLPRDERGFRGLFWRQVIQAEAHPAMRMPSRRGNAFVEIALRRARALTPYANGGDLDAEAVDRLRGDSLIVSAENHEALLAPAHDVLEDWAVLHWLDEQSTTADGSVAALAAAVGPYPAVRRSYRKWLGELVALDGANAGRLFDAAAQSKEGDLPPYFQDDTLVSLLRASSAPEFLRQREADLLANDKRIFLRIIHLLRVACVTAPPWTAANEGLLFSVPEGTSWAGVLSLVASNLRHFTARDCPLLLGLIEDWARGVSWQNPYPDGASAAAGIAHWLLPLLSGYRTDKDRGRALRIIAQIPKSDPEGLQRLLSERTGQRHADRLADELCELLFDGLGGWAIARDLPDVLIAAGLHYFLASEDDLNDERGYRRSRLGVDLAFGLNERHGHFAPPASALRGPFLPLLRWHPRKGLDFIYKVFNHSVDWYVHPRIHDPLEPASQFVLTFEAGLARTQWCNGRLWVLYRGMSVAPYSLQTMLMALEQWLRERAEATPQQLDGLLLEVLRSSDSAALTAVAAAVATAYPVRAPETLLVLLRSKWPVQFDRSRFAGELSSPSAIFDHLPSQREDELYVKERRAADAKPYRRRDLETAVCDLQLSAHKPRVWDVLDQLRAAVPPLEQRDEDDRVWLLSLHRMDLRQYTASEEEVPAAARQADQACSPPNYVVLRPNDPEPDVKAMSDATAAESRRINDRLGLFLWGHAAFARGDGKADPGEWRTRLAESRSSPASDAEDHGGMALGEGGPGFVAAVCVRDRWAELTNEEQAWCVDTVCGEILRSGDVWNRHERVQLGAMSADRACAFAVSVLADESLAAEQRDRVRHSLVVAITHPADEVRRYAADGVGANLWSRDRGLALRCVNVVATAARLQQRAADRARRRRVIASADEDEAAVKGIIDEIRRRFDDDAYVRPDAYATLDTRNGFGAEANMRALMILGFAHEDPVSVAAFRRLAETLVAWWDSEDEERRSFDRVGQSRNYQLEFGLRHQLERFVIRTSGPASLLIIAPLLDAVERHPKEVGQFVEGLIVAADHSGNSARFWELWTPFADRTKIATWLGKVDTDYGFGHELVSALFLGTSWKDGVRHWLCLDGFQALVPGLFDALPPGWRALHDFVRFLYHVGERSLPGAFAQISASLRAGAPSVMLSSGNTVFMLERLLQRFIYGRPAEMKSRAELREAVLFLLDALVECGSSAAFRMRDDFVTPISAG